MTGFGAAICSLIFPLAAKCSDSIIYAYIIRVIMGATQGALFPAVYVLLCEWLPKDERSKWLPYPSSFSRFGAIVMNLVIPSIMKAYGWEAVFYVSGGTTLIWCVLFIVFGSNSPDQSYWISKQELSYIQSNLEPKVSSITQKQTNILTVSSLDVNESVAKESEPSVSFCSMLFNRPLWILTIVMFSSEWSNMLLMVKLPNFLEDALRMDTGEVGIWGAILISLYCIQYPLSGYCAQRMENLGKDYLYSLNVRKIFEAIGEFDDFLMTCGASTWHSLIRFSYS